MATARLRRRPLLLAALLLLIVYIAVSLIREPGVTLGVPPAWSPRNIIPHRKSPSTPHQAVLDRQSHQPSASPGAAPGFERALPSCRVADLVDDPLVKEYGQNNIRLSRTYEGTGHRVRKLLQKVIRGEKIKIAAVGGSVSTVRRAESRFSGA
jgi:hypothetical protein